MICCRGSLNKIVGNWNKNIYHRHGNRTTTITHVLLWRENFNHKKIWITVEENVYSYEMTRKFLRSHYVPMKTQLRLYGKTYRSQEGDAANQISCAPFGPNRSTCPSLSSKHHKHNIQRYENALIQLKEEDLTKRLLSSFCVPPASKRRRSRATYRWS